MITKVQNSTFKFKSMFHVKKCTEMEKKKTTAIDQASLNPTYKSAEC